MIDLTVQPPFLITREEYARTKVRMVLILPPHNWKHARTHAFLRRTINDLRPLLDAAGDRSVPGGELAAALKLDETLFRFIYRAWQANRLIWAAERLDDMEVSR